MMPVYKRADGTYEIEHPNGGRYHATHDTAINIEMVESYLDSLSEEEREHALVPEPALPEPTEEEKAEARRAAIRAELATLDAKAIRPLRAIAAVNATEADIALLADLDARAAELRAEISS